MGSSQKADVFPLGPLPQLLPLPLVEAQWRQLRFLALAVFLNCLLLPASSTGGLVRLSHFSLAWHLPWYIMVELLPAC